MKRPKKQVPPKSPTRELTSDKLRDVRGGHAIVDPMAGAFRNFTPDN